MLISFPFSIFFNFYYLPFRQAIHMPIILYRPTFIALKGKVIIDSPKIHFGQIRLGLFNTPIINGKGFVWMNEGGKVLFHGSACLGAGSVVKMRAGATLEIGDNVGNAASVKIDCNYEIKLKDHVSIGWDTIILDSNLHRMKNIDGTWCGKGYAPILIGNNSWITSKCIILPGTIFPSKSVCATGSILNRDYSKEGHGLFAGNPLCLRREGCWRDIEDNTIVYESIKKD